MSTIQPTDRIFLRELAVECIIGFLDWERLVKQTVYLDIEVPVDCRRAALSDDVAHTLDYKHLSKVVIAFVAVPNSSSWRPSPTGPRSSFSPSSTFPG
jgi:FolB domain-containing protein